MLESMSSSFSSELFAAKCAARFRTLDEDERVGEGMRLGEVCVGEPFPRVGALKVDVSATAFQSRVVALTRTRRTGVQRRALEESWRLSLLEEILDEVGSCS
jgi:hypothetical protein